MAEELCDCCDLPPYSCGKAAADRQRRDLRAQIDRALAEPGIVAAKHLIRECPGCGATVPVGYPIRRSVDGWVGVMCCGGLDA